MLSIKSGDDKEQYKVKNQEHVKKEMKSQEISMVRRKIYHNHSGNSSSWL